MENLCDLTYDEINNLLEACQEELQKRREEEQEQLWFNVVSSIKEFLQKAGDIEIYDKVGGGFSYITNKSTNLFPSIGCIDIN